jgi:4-hydroxybenzoate polyprenyltransferase
VSEAAVRGAVVVALIACIALSLAVGLRAAAVHLALLVGSGWAYNLGLKRTRWSAAAYAVAFGSLPAVVTLALPRPVLPPPWMVAVGALLGVGAHLLNALPDLADDALTGVHGLPHRLGARRVRVLAPLVLVVASVVTVLGPGAPASPWPWTALGGCVLLGVVATSSRGRAPFVAAVAIALVDVATLVLRA